MDHQPASVLRGGRHYPRNYAELLAWFPDDDACVDYLEWLRWPEGFTCPHCTMAGGWKLCDGRFWCETCRRRISVTAGTIFHRTRTPLTVWFATAWFMTSAKNGVSAKTLHRLLGFGSYQTAWAMLHRFRRAMVRPGRERLAGLVEVDETVVGGVKPGKRGRGAAGKALVLIAVEHRKPKGFGRCRMRVVSDVRASVLRSFLADSVEGGSVLMTDGLSPYPAAVGENYVHRPFTLAGTGLKAHEVLPGVHRVASLLKRWLLGTHQGAVQEDHLQEYLDEYAFRFNRRKAEFRGLLFRRLLEQAVLVGPLSYRSMITGGLPKRKKPLPPHGGRPRAMPLDNEEAPRRPLRAHNI